MNRNEFNILNNIYNASKGRAEITTDLEMNAAIADNETYKSLEGRGFIDAKSGEITKAGLEALKPYKVDNAVIMAAGSATRFIPLSLEQPKALYEVRGERLIERQIKQLLEAGIEDITIVLGYKRDAFAFLQDKYPVKFIFNPKYNVKNNIESLNVARKELKNTYVCACDSYYVENPFNTYEFETYYAGYTTDIEMMDEMYVTTDEAGAIAHIVQGGKQGQILLGQSYWTANFSKKFLQLVDADAEDGKYAHKFWEWMVNDNLSDLPAVHFKEYAAGEIFEFDYFEQLREFDNRYVGQSHSEIIRNIKLVFRCDEEDIVDFRKVNEGMTNTSFIFKIDGVDYIYRHPGDGTESIINRRNEKTSLVKAKEFGIDPTYIYMDINEGWKISLFIHDFREPDYADFEDAKKVIDVMRRLHAVPVKVDYGMKPWEDAVAMEKLIKKKNPTCFDEYEGLKAKVEKLYQETVGDGIESCFCHGDTYKPNWMIKPDGEVILIDWEYSGMSDPGIDVGYYIVDAQYDVDMAERFIREYLQDNEMYFGVDYTYRYNHFMNYIAIIAYYWFVWALYRESCGAHMGHALYDWRDAAIKYADYLLNK